jgi:hypothetical protein
MPTLSCQELSSINMVHKHELSSSSRESKESFVSVYPVYFVSSPLYKGDGLQQTICAHYSWEMALNVSHDESISNT